MSAFTFIAGLFLVVEIAALLALALWAVNSGGAAVCSRIAYRLYVWAERWQADMDKGVRDQRKQWTDTLERPE